MIGYMSGEWWRRAVVYQIYIRSFADGDGDGVGDLPGIRQRLPHLRELGVDAVWITPWYPSPMADGGYDVADYRDIDPLFGTLADAEAMIEDAHRLGLKVIIDIVPNHSSDRHPWFRNALSSRPGSPERDRYIFRPGRGPHGAEPPTNWQSAFGGPAWRRVPSDRDSAPAPHGGTPDRTAVADEWYLHLYAPEQPDLNWRNPEVVADFERTLRFWLDRGVDGLRVDAATVLCKDPAFPDAPPGAGTAFSYGGGPDHPFRDRDEIHDVYRGWRAVVDGYRDRMLIGECWVPSPERLALYLRPDEMHAAFNFQLLQAPWDLNALRKVIDSSVASMAAVGAPTTWVLSNHDVTRHATRYARLDTTGGGVAPGDRAGPDTPLDPPTGLRRARAAALLMLALPGSAYVYQGDELGLPEVLDLPESVLQDPIWTRTNHEERGRDGCRVPIPWERDGPSFGFGPGGSWLPQPASWGALSRAAQTGVRGSTLELYRAALAIRREHPALGDGGMRWHDGEPGTLVLGREPGFRCVVNFGPATVPLPVHDRVLLTSDPLTGAAELPPDTAAWLAT